LLLALSVISRQAQFLGASQFRIFDHRGGSIGRSKQADWCLEDPDQVLSNRHAAVHFVDGRFLVEDTSTNGTGFNRPDALLTRQQPVPLTDGDHLFLGDFEILVQIIADAAAPAPQPIPASPASYGAPPYSPPPMAPSGYNPPAAAPYAPPPSAPSLHPYPDHTDLPVLNAPGRSMEWQAESPSPVWPLPPEYGPAADPPGYGQGGLGDLMGSSNADPWASNAFPDPAAAAPMSGYAPQAAPPMHAYAPPPPPTAAPPAWPPPEPPAAHAAAGGYAPPEAAPAYGAAYPPQPEANAYGAPPAPAGASVDLNALFQAIGLDPQQVLPETGTQIGTILRVVTQGLVEVLRARAAVKNQFRMNATFIRPVENNPLKFARDPDDALHTLFVKRNPGYLGAVDSYREAFDDLGRHQLAMLAGMQAAFAAVLQRFSPQTIESSCDKAMQGRAGLLGGVMKPRYWEFYKEHYESIAQDSDSAFQQVFGEAFVRAYDDQIRRLEAAARQRR